MIFPSQVQLDTFKACPGAISVCEMVAIMNLAHQAPENGACLDIGSHAGKSAMSAACGLRGGRELHCIDPIYDLTNRDAWSHSVDKVPENCSWTYAMDADFHANVLARIHACNPMIVPNLHGDCSEHGIQRFEDIAWCFVDSDTHDYPLLKRECELLRTRMSVGGIIAFHDFASQFLAVERCYRELLDGWCYEEVGIPWHEIKDYVRSIGGESGNESWHHTEMEFPAFVGALRRIK